MPFLIVIAVVPLYSQPDKHHGLECRISHEVLSLSLRTEAHRLSKLATVF
jgi:hypothetical protein